MPLFSRGEPGSPMKFGPMTAVLFLVLGFALSSILQTLGSLSPAARPDGNSFVQLYRSFGGLMPAGGGAAVSRIHCCASSGFAHIRLRASNSSVKDLSVQLYRGFCDLMRAGREAAASGIFRPYCFVLSIRACFGYGSETHFKSH
jgi:hypothetical protein